MAKRAIEDTVVAVRGGGDLATGTVQKLVHAGFRVVIIETSVPLMIRRTVSLGSAVLDGQATVEDMTAVLTTEKIWKKYGKIIKFLL